MQRNTQNALYHGTIWKTDNILLRDIILYDFHAIHRYASNPHATEYLPWGPNPPQETQAFIDYAIKKAQDNPRYIWELAVCHMQTGELIGGCALRRMSPYSSIAEIGFIINPTYQGSGYATEAASGLLAFGYSKLALYIIYATCHPENTASTRVLKKIGMSWVGTMQEREDTPYMHRYEITHAYRQRHEKHSYDLNDA